MNKEPKYSIEVFDDYATIRGRMSSDILVLLVRLCKKEKFTHMTNTDDGEPGFKLVRR